MGIPNATTLLHMVEIGLLARKTVETRFELFKLQARARVRAAALGAGLATVAAVFGIFALGLVLAAIAWAIQLSGQSWPAALLMTAGGVALISLCFGLAARAALKRAARD